MKERKHNIINSKRAFLPILLCTQAVSILLEFIGEPLMTLMAMALTRNKPGLSEKRFRGNLRREILFILVAKFRWCTF